MAKQRGGARKGAGRPKGAKDHAKLQLNAKIAKAMLEGSVTGGKITPLEVLLKAMHYNWDVSTATKDSEMKIACMREAANYAREAAPYLHARLASTELKGDPNKPLSVPNLIVTFTEAPKAKE